MSKRAAFVYDQAMSAHILRDDHPLKATRLRYTHELLEAYGAFGLEGSRLVKPKPATDSEIMTVHSQEYVEAVQSFGRGETHHNLGRFNFSVAGDNPIYPGIYEASALSTGASLVAAEMVANGEVDVAFNISGGLHHAAPSSAAGFCVFNDPAIAIEYLVNRGLRVAYVDIDAHHGDGVQNIFYQTDRVMTISIHESGMFLFPGSGHVEEIGEGRAAGYSVNVPLYPHTGDETYIGAFREVVPRLVEAFKPDVLVGQLGIDNYHSDPLTHLMLTSKGYTEAVAELSALGIPWVAMGGGGYDQGAVARCWSLAYGIMLGKEWPDDIPESFREAHGLTLLRDREAPAVNADIQGRAQQFADDSVERVRELVFPVHQWV